MAKRPVRGKVRRVAREVLTTGIKAGTTTEGTAVDINSLLARRRIAARDDKDRETLHGNFLRVQMSVKMFGKLVRRLHREREQAAANRDRERERAEAEHSEAYDEWWAMAWQPRAPSARLGAGYEGDQSYDSHADNRGHKQREHSRADNRSSSAWTPSVPPAGRRQGRDRTRSPKDRRAFSPGRGRNRGNPYDRGLRHIEPAPRNEQCDWDEDHWARSNERFRRVADETSGPVDVQPTKASPFPISQNINLEVVGVIVG